MKPHTEPLEHAGVRQYCKLVRVPAIGASFVSLAEQAVKENQSHIRYLEALLQVESSMYPPSASSRIFAAGIGANR